MDYITLEREEERTETQRDYFIFIHSKRCSISATLGSSGYLAINFPATLRDEEQEKWYISIVDVIAALTDSID